MCTNGRNYDRHQTRYGAMIIQLTDFEIRTSGSIATVQGENQKLEFRSDSNKSIENNEVEIIFEINMKEKVWRRIKISEINPVNNNR